MRWDAIDIRRDTIVLEVCVNSVPGLLPVLVTMTYGSRQLCQASLTPIQIVSQGQQCTVCGLQTSDALLAYGPLVAHHFGASYSLLAWSGAGILRRGCPRTYVYHQMPAYHI